MDAQRCPFLSAAAHAAPPPGTPGAPHARPDLHPPNSCPYIANRPHVVHHVLSSSSLASSSSAADMAQLDSSSSTYALFDSSSAAASSSSSDGSSSGSSGPGVPNAAALAAARAPPPAAGVHQAWRLPARPAGADAGRAKLTRRELRKLGRSWPLAEVARHSAADDAWIAVDGRVYDITEHLLNHPGWEGAGITTVLSIIAHLGTDCSAEFEEIHRPWPVAWRQLAAYDIGPLDGA